MANLTIVILTKNEEQNLKKCIKSFKNIAQRVVIIDSYWYRYLVDAKLYECEKLGVKMEKQGALEATSSKWWVTPNNRVTFIYVVYHSTEMEVAA